MFITFDSHYDTSANFIFHMRMEFETEDDSDDNSTVIVGYTETFLWHGIEQKRTVMSDPIRNVNGKRVGALDEMLRTRLAKLIEYRSDAEDQIQHCKDFLTGKFAF